MNNQSVKTELKQVKVDSLSLSTKAKRRSRTSVKETKILEDFYKKNPSPNKEQKEEIANVVQMGERNVHFWFQNRRAKDNKKKRFVERKQKELSQWKTHQRIQGVSSQRDIPGPSRQRKSIIQSLETPKGKFKLPSIASLMDEEDQRPLSPLDMPLYFHHKYFGIEQSSLLEKRLRSAGKGKAIAISSIVTERH